MEEWDGSALPRCSAHGKNDSITSKAGTTSKTKSGSIVCAHTNLTSHKGWHHKQDKSGSIVYPHTNLKPHGGMGWERPS